MPINDQIQALACYRGNLAPSQSGVGHQWRTISMLLV